MRKDEQKRLVRGNSVRAHLPVIIVGNNPFQSHPKGDLKLSLKEENEISPPPSTHDSFQRSSR